MGTAVPVPYGVGWAGGGGKAGGGGGGWSVCVSFCSIVCNTAMSTSRWGLWLELYVCALCAHELLVCWWLWKSAALFNGWPGEVL